MSRLRFSASLLKSPMLNQNCKSDLNLTSWTSLLRTKPRISRINAQVPVRRMGRYEPSYLDEINYEPRYEAVQLRIKGHDFPVLEKYMKFSTSSASRFEIKIEESYPIPTRQTKISHFDPKENGKQGAKVIEEFTLHTFERVVNLKNVDAKAFPLFIEFLRNHQPEGVTFSTGLPDPELEKFRYIPDMEMTVLSRKLDDLDSGKIDSLTWRE